MKFINTHRKILATAVALALFIFLLLIKFHVVADSRPGFYANCKQAAAHHDTNIPSTSRSYRVQLDRDHDGIACEQ